MSDKDLEEKIFEIVRPIVKKEKISCNEENACAHCWCICTIDMITTDIVDALIAAGLKFDTVVSHTATFNLAQLDYINNLERRVAEAEHRAEVSERALRNRARAYVELQGYPDHDVAILAEEIVVPEDLKQAKNELAEEAKRTVRRGQ